MSCPIALPAICDLQPGLAAALGHCFFFLDDTRVPITTSPHSTQVRKCFDSATVLMEGGRGEVVVEQESGF
jgi:hypothetical protein